MNPLDNIVVVLDQPKDLVNVAGVVRAMKNTGVRRLRLVRPDEFDAYRITGIAHRSDDIVDAVEFFDDLPAALADVVFTVGTTARRRTAGLRYDRPRSIAPDVIERAASGPVAIIMGREDRGLANDALDLCNIVTMIPTHPEYPSLNLAQACLILLHEVFLSSVEADAPLPRGRRATEPATGSDLEEMYAALEGGLSAIEFFKSRKPESVLRTLRAILGQATMDHREARLVAAVGYETRHFVRRLQEGQRGGTGARPEEGAGGEPDDGTAPGHPTCRNGGQSDSESPLEAADPDETHGPHGQRQND